MDADTKAFISWLTKEKGFHGGHRAQFKSAFEFYKKVANTSHQVVVYVYDEHVNEHHIKGVSFHMCFKNTDGIWITIEPYSMGFDEATQYLDKLTVNMYEASLMLGADVENYNPDLEDE